MHTVVAEPLAHGAAGERREILQRRRFARGRGDHDRVFHRAGIFERLHNLCDRRALLPDGDIDAVELDLLVARFVNLALIDDRVDGDSGLAGLPVADDQLALAATDGNERVDRLQSRLHRLVHRAARNDTRCLHVHASAFGDIGERAFAVDRIAQRVHDATEQALTDWHVHDGAGALDRVAFLDVLVGAEDHDADIVVLKVQRHALDGTGKLHHLAGLDIVEAIDAGDAVADAEHFADFADLGLGAEALNLALEDGGNFSGLDVHVSSFQSSTEVRSQKSEIRKLIVLFGLGLLRGSRSEFWFLISNFWRALSGAAHRHAHAFELGTQAGVDHARADLHNETAKQRWVDFRLELDFARQLGFQDRAQFRRLVLRQRARARDLRRHFPALLCDQALISAHNIRQRK